MTSKTFRHSDNTPGIAYYERGRVEVQNLGFLVEFECLFEMEKSDSGHWVSCGFDRLQEIKITPDDDVPKLIPYPELASLEGWMAPYQARRFMQEAEEDAERRANEKD